MNILRSRTTLKRSHAAYLKSSDAIIYAAYRELGLPARMTYRYTNRGTGAQVLSDHLRLRRYYEEDELVNYMNKNGQLVRVEKFFYKESDSEGDSDDTGDDEGEHDVINEEGEGKDIGKGEDNDDENHTKWIHAPYDLPMIVLVMKPARNFIEKTFIAYGNQAEIDFRYRRGCLVVDIRKPEENIPVNGIVSVLNALQILLNNTVSLVQITAKDRMYVTFSNTNPCLK